MAAKINLDWPGLKDLINGFKMLPDEVSKEFQKAQKENLKDAAKVLADYPMQLLGTHYHRTKTLKRGWLDPLPKINILGGGVNFAAEIRNDVPYAGEVQGGSGELERQTHEFKRRNWKTTDQALAETAKDSQDRLDKAVQKVLDKLGKK